MPGWFNHLFVRQRDKEPLRGAPEVRRVKHYSALSGYAYEYFFEGRRTVERGEEYVFSVSGDRKDWFEATVLLEESAVESWQRTHGLTLEPRERYAAAKMCLFAAFDGRDDPRAMHAPVTAGEDQLDEFLGQLGLG